MASQCVHLPSLEHSGPQATLRCPAYGAKVVPEGQQMVGPASRSNLSLSTTAQCLRQLLSPNTNQVIAVETVLGGGWQEHIERYELRDRLRKG